MTSDQLTAPAAIKPVEILVVDDSPEDIRLIRDAFSLWKGNRRVQVFLNGVEVLNHFKNCSEESSPDLILLDIQLPDISGEEAARRLKADAQTRAIPIIAVTAFAMPGDREKILESGCDDYISKPFSIREFLELVGRYTGETTVEAVP